MGPTDPLLAVEGLTVGIGVERSSSPVVRDVSLWVSRGEMVGLVGESGSGKTMTALAVLRLLPAEARIEAGRALLEGEDLCSLDEEAMRRVRGGRIGIVFQEAMTALNPALTVGYQICEGIRAHRPATMAEARAEAEGLLDLVAMPGAKQRMKEYPHQLSGGQRQRALIAMALGGRPTLLIADEPTTALDVTVQAEILGLLESLRLQLGLAVLLITHDLAVVAETCDRVVVMYAGEVVEEGAVEEVFKRPHHPYTQGLLRTLPRPGKLDRSQLLEVIPGQAALPGSRPEGCAFHPRCDQVMDRCRQEVPVRHQTPDGGMSRCFLAEAAGR